MSPMQTSGIIRPLLHVSKKEILEYAAAHKLSWHEDSTNLDQKYRRNYVRHSVVPRLNDSKKQFVALSDQASVRNQEIDALLGELDTWVRDKNGVIIRSRMVCLPFSVGKEYMHHLLTRAAIQNINTDLLYRLVIAVKTLQPGKKIDVDNRHWLQSYGSTVEILQK
jgi:tRNA(Ile)-lysidine synthase TilS/MesJ